MFRLDVLQMQWLTVALAVGLFLVLCVALLCRALWRPRPEDGLPAARKSALGFLPALLVLTYAGVLLFAVVYTACMARQPPNW